MSLGSNVVLPNPCAFLIIPEFSLLLGVLRKWWWGLSTSGLCLLGAGGAGSLGVCGCVAASFLTLFPTRLQSHETPRGTGAHSPPVGAVSFCRLFSRAHSCLEAGQTCCLSAKLVIFERGLGSHCVLLFPWENTRKWADLTKGTLYCSDVFPFVQSFSLHKFPRNLWAGTTAWNLGSKANIWVSLHSPPPKPPVYPDTRQGWGLLIRGRPDPPDRIGVL